MRDSLSGRPEAAGSAQPDALGQHEVLDEVRRVLAGIRHGSVTLIVQDGRVVQIDATQKLRFREGRAGPRQ